MTIEAGIPSSPASRETTPHGQEDLETKPDATHQTSCPPLRPAPQTAAACKAHFWLLFLQPKKVTRPQARSAGRNGFAVEFEFNEPPHPATVRPSSRGEIALAFEVEVEVELEVEVEIEIEIEMKSRPHPARVLSSPQCEVPWNSNIGNRKSEVENENPKNREFRNSGPLATPGE